MLVLFQSRILLKQDGATFFWASRVRTKDFVADHASIVVQAASLLFFLKSPHLAVWISPANFLTIQCIRGRVSSINNRPEENAILLLSNFTGVSTSIKT